MVGLAGTVKCCLTVMLRWLFCMFAWVGCCEFLVFADVLLVLGKPVLVMFCGGCFVAYLIVLFSLLCFFRLLFYFVYVRLRCWLFVVICLLVLL